MWERDFVNLIGSDDCISSGGNLSSKRVKCSDFLFEGNKGRKKGQRRGREGNKTKPNKKQRERGGGERAKKNPIVNRFGRQEEVQPISEQAI